MATGSVITILHASDVHFGKPYDGTAGEAFQALAREVPAELIVVSGDFTQRAKVREYAAARAWLDRLPRVPLVVTPGNHDVPLYRVWERVLAPYRNYRRYIARELDTVTRIPGLTAVALNSTAPLRRIVDGSVGARQLDFAARRFREAPAADFRLLVLHHPLIPPPDESGDRAMPDARAVLEAAAGMEVDLVLGGHHHRAYAALERGVPIVESGTTTSRRGRGAERGRNTCNVVRIERDRLEVTPWTYASESGRFVPLPTRALPRRGSAPVLAPTPRVGEVGER